MGSRGRVIQLFLAHVEHLINDVGNDCLLQVHENNNGKKHDHLVPGLALPLICVF